MILDSIASTIAGTIEAIVPGAIGSAISLRFIQGTKTNRIFSFLAGLAFAYYCGNGLVEYWHIEGRFTSTAIPFTVGVFGLAIVNQIQQQIPDIITALRKRWIG